jgi:hypothetical protein
LTRSGSTSTVAPRESASAPAGEHPDDMSLDAPPAPLHIELSDHRLGQLVRVELASMGKLHNPNRDKLDDGN